MHASQMVRTLASGFYASFLIRTHDYIVQFESIVHDRVIKRVVVLKVTTAFDVMPD